MESKSFDDLVRGAFASSSRRGVVRVGICALAASAMATLGLRANDAEAKKKKKKTICNCTSTDPGTCATQKPKKSKANDILNSNPCAYSGSCQAGVSGCPAQCAADRPVVCGEGCCPAEFSKCCVNVEDPIFTNTCNPTSFTCCPANAGGGSCPPDSKCCPITTRDPDGGICAPLDGDCCTSEEGGGRCGSGLVCCTVTEDEPQGACCPSADDCCAEDTDCEAGSICDNGCCVVEPPRSAGSRKTRDADRFRMVAN